jgi:hypothetical protein
MVYTLYKPNLWGYSKGNFIYRVNFFYRKAVEILMSVVIGALILTGLYLLFKDNTPWSYTEDNRYVQFQRLI